MINLYKCERCGKLFDNYDDCGKCEDSHKSIDWWKTQDTIFHGTLSYDEEKEMPKTVELISETVWEDYNVETNTWKKREYVGTYKLVKIIKRDIQED